MERRRRWPRPVGLCQGRVGRNSTGPERSRRGVRKRHRRRVRKRVRKRQVEERGRSRLPASPPQPGSTEQSVRGVAQHSTNPRWGGGNNAQVPGRAICDDAVRIRIGKGSEPCLILQPAPARAAMHAAQHAAAPSCRQPRIVRARNPFRGFNTAWI